MKTEKISLPRNETLTLISTFATMINAGIPILEIVDTLLDEAKGNLKKLLMSVREDLIQGQPLHMAFAKFPLIFDKISVNLIKASEEAGTLHIVLKDLRDQIQKDMEFTDKIKSALLYPLIVLIVFVGVLMVILFFVIPRIGQVFIELGVDLPLPTRILIFMSDSITKNTIPVILIFIIIIASIHFLFKYQKGLVFGFLFNLPIISEIVKAIDLTRLFRSMYLLLNSGVIITSALELAQDVVVRQDVAKSIKLCQETVLSGKRLSEALKERREIFSGTIVKIVEAGERTGTLDKSMNDLAQDLDYKVTRMLTTSTKLIEPIMLVVMSILVGGMMMSIIAPIYGLVGSIGS
jgi:type II secretory pathway component PulF